MTREEKAIKYLKTLNEGLQKGRIIDTLTGDNVERDEVFATAIEALDFLDKVGSLYEKLLLHRVDILQKKIEQDRKRGERMNRDTLEQAPCNTCGYEEGSIYCKEHCPHEAKIEQKPCGDAIDRKLVCAFIDGLISDDGERKKGLEYIRNMPPVDHQETVTEFADRCRECGKRYVKRQTGHWIVVSDGYGDNAYICECSECKDTVWVYKDADRKWNYCPNCGVKMVEPQERSGEE